MCVLYAQKVVIHSGKELESPPIIIQERVWKAKDKLKVTSQVNEIRSGYVDAKVYLHT